MSSGRFVLRVTVGGLMLGHGLQKLNGSFGGPGLEATQESMGAIGLYPAKQQGLAAALSETIGGGLTAAGFLSPLGPAMITGTMLVAIKKVHAKNGVWVTKGGYEYNATIIAAALSLATAGPGILSLDGLLRKRRSGLGWGVVALALGAGGAAATLAVSNKMQPDAVPADESEAEPADAEVTAD
jgi:putative oxidoreductase